MEEEIYFHKQKYECDFLIKKDLKISHAIQVTKTLKDPEVKKREYRGLLEAMHIINSTEGLILTMDEEGYEEIQEENYILQIQILPTWKWFLSQKSKRAVAVNP